MEKKEVLNVVERGAKAISRFLEIYRIGMQSLLQGYREVTQGKLINLINYRAWERSRGSEKT